MKTLLEIQNHLKVILPEGIDLAFQAIKAQLAPGTDKFNDLILIESRYLDVSRQLLQGVLSQEAALLEFNKVRKDILDFIDSLQESQLLNANDGAATDGRPDIYNGEVFYRIPKKMQMQQVVKCIVRLAFDRKILTEGLEVEDTDVLKDLRISEVMGVELLDSTGGAFEISTIHDTVQIVEKDLFTEWVFNVKPVMEGTHPLVLKISIIEIKDGIERKRNVVLEEQVVVVTEPVPEEKVAEKRAAAVHVGGVMAQPSGPGPDVKSMAPRPAAPSPAAPARKRAFPMLGKALAALIVIVVASMVVWNSMQSPTVTMPGGTDVVTIDPNDSANVPEPAPSAEVVAWENAQLSDTRNSYEDFVREYPASSYVVAAMRELASIETATYEAATTVAALQAYLEAYPDGTYVAAARTRIQELKNLNRRPPRRNEPQPANPGRSSAPTGTGTTEQRPRPRVETPIATTPTPTVNPNDVVPLRNTSRKPVFKGCDNDDKAKEERCTRDKIFRYLDQKLKYPEEARRRKIEGTVLVEFTVERDGSITEIQYSNDPGGGIGREAVRLIQEMPKFKPGLNAQGQPIRVRYAQPITFKLR